MDIVVALSEDKERLMSLIDEAMFKIHLEMEERIFEELKDSKGGSPDPYSTKPLWVASATLPRQAGRKSKTGKTSYFEGGYSQLKREVGRPPMKLNNFLFNDFTSGLRKINEKEYHVVLDEINKKKVDGNFKRFFKPSEEEIDNLKKNLGGK